MDVVLLSRLQFAITIAFHYLFPPLSIGLGWILVAMNGLYVRTGNPLHGQVARFWTKVFAVNFAVGVATGIVMEFQFGTNWATYSRFVGDVFGSALASEGIFAFFLESGFLSLLVFGWDRIPKKMHLFATVMVAFGATFSSVWIVVANSWMQTPAGYHIVGTFPHARAEITDFWAMVFNPSAMTRLSHVLIGAFVLGSSVVASISAWYLLKERHKEFAQVSFKIALVMFTVASCMTLVTGHRSAEVVARYQPAKLAAMEGHYKTGPAPLYAMGMPDDRTETTRGIAVPGGLSLLVKGNPAASIAGLDQFPKNERPPVAPTFQFYHLMITIGLGFIGLSLLSCLLWWQGKLFTNRFILTVFVWAVVPAYIANQVGWYTAEVGRQPWIVYGLMRTDAAVSKAITDQMVLGSIILFTLIYIALFALYLFILNDKIQKGPHDPSPKDTPEGTTPTQPEYQSAPMFGLLPTTTPQNEATLARSEELS